MFLPALLLATVLPQAPAPSAENPTTKARMHLLVAQAVRMDPRRRSLVVKTGDQPPVELQIGVEEGRTRVTSSGRAARLEDLRPGDRVAISCTDDAAGAHLARLIVIRPRGGASPTPTPTPTPAAQS
jgi:hypothetical protein